MVATFEGKMPLLILSVVMFLVSTDAQTIGDGTLRLVINDQSTIYYTSGIVEVYYNDTWGTICSTSTFGQTEADVVCRQQGFTGASSYSTAGQQSYGTASNSIISSVNCGTVTNYLVLFQCDMTFMSDVCLPSNAVTVNCLSTRIWDSPYTGQLRLQRGRYSNEGLVEVYCNEQWGTTCGLNFSENSASSVCTQLGYNEALSFDILSITGNTSQPIWLNNVNCSSVYNCLSTCQSCPSTQVSTCGHNEDITIQCYYERSSSQNGGIINGCEFEYDAATDIDLSKLGLAILLIILIICTFVGFVVGFVILYYTIVVVVGIYSVACELKRRKSALSRNA